MLCAGLKRVRPFVAAGSSGNVHQYYRRHTAGTSRSVQCCATMQQAFTIIGGGRVGQALADMGPGSDVIVRRGEPISGPPGPILVATRNDALDGIVDATPEDRRQGEQPVSAQVGSGSSL
eukprot:GHRQ01037589.1.p1 GENE.GHRQ01037589.1~~GHRQ01037589.1.p1  ORF type:complete len:120 (+),score=23.60 GHRQ01037589.1:165-524(+)